MAKKKNSDAEYVKMALAIASGGIMAWIIGGWLQRNIKAINPNVMSLNSEIIRVD